MNKCMIIVFVFMLFASCAKKEFEENEYLETNNINSAETTIYNNNIQKSLNAQENPPQKDNWIQATIDIDENLNEEQKEFFTSITEISTSMSRDADLDDWESWHDKNNQIIELLVAFLKTDTTWFIDITKYLPFMKVSISDDDILKIYSWTLERWGTGDYFNNIIQYKTKSGTINAIEMKGPPQYMVGCILKSHLYLLLGDARAGGGIGFSVFKAIEISDDELLPYPAFNGSSELSFFASPWEDRTQIDNLNLNFKDQPFSIKFITHDDREFEFIFSDSEFMGDYEKFDEIRH